LQLVQAYNWKIPNIQSYLQIPNISTYNVTKVGGLSGVFHELTGHVW